LINTKAALKNFARIAAYDTAVLEYGLKSMGTAILRIGWTMAEIPLSINDRIRSDAFQYSNGRAIDVNIGAKIINLARPEGGSCIGIPRRSITQSKLIILTPILSVGTLFELLSE
jgi:hypothetical protein